MKTLSTNGISMMKYKQQKTLLWSLLGNKRNRWKAYEDREEKLAIMLTSSAKNKGRILENFVTQLIRDKGLDNRASRNPGSGSGKQKGDIFNALGWTLECKNTRKCPGKAEFTQVAREAMGYTKEAIIWHSPQTSLDESHAIINIHDFFDLIKQSKEPKTINEPTKSLGYKLANAKRAIQELIKEL